ncbi:MAG: group II intron maturase-specific domain-containing protein [Oliverpabstia sp.]
MKNKLRELTCQGNRWSNPERERRLQNYVGGWLNYFRYAHMKSLMRRTDEWLRHRIRAVYWKQWKRVRANYPPIRL